MTPTIFEVYEVFSHVLGVPCALAGGAVRDHLRGETPRDYDMFCFKSPNICDVYERLSGGAYTLMPFHYVKAYCSRVLELTWRGVVVQLVMPRRAFHDVPTLLADFDWSICQHAYDGEFHTAETSCLPRAGEMLKLVNRKTPKSSLGRGFMFAKRFHMDIYKADLMWLCSQVLEEEQHAVDRPDLTGFRRDINRTERVPVINPGPIVDGERIAAAAW